MRAEARVKEMYTRNVYMPNHEQIPILTICSIMKIRAEHLNNSMTGTHVVTYMAVQTGRQAVRLNFRLSQHSHSCLHLCLDFREVEI
jgi:hypothetical protein